MLRTCMNNYAILHSSLNFGAEVHVENIFRENSKYLKAQFKL